MKVPFDKGPRRKGFRAVRRSSGKLRRSLTYWKKETYKRKESRIERFCGLEFKRKAYRKISKTFTIQLETRKLSKSVRGMPRLSEAKKDVTSCDKLRGGANIPRSADFRMGKPGMWKTCHL